MLLLSHVLAFFSPSTVQYQLNAKAPEPFVINITAVQKYMQKHLKIWTTLIYSGVLSFVRLH